MCIVNWNTRTLLHNCLTSLHQLTDRIALEVIVTDNASHDGSRDMLAQEFPQVSMIANRENRGFGLACNQGFEISAGRHILFLNSDTVVLPGTLESMVKYLDHHPTVGGVGCMLLNRDGSPQRSAWYGFISLQSAIIDALYLWRLFPRSRLVRASEVNRQQRSVPVSVDHLLGACLIIPRRVIDKVGLFDPCFFMFLEETDLCYRIKQAGYELHYLPQASIIHFGGESTKQDPAMKRQLYRSQCLFLRKHGASRLYLAAFKGITAVALVIRMGLWSIRFATVPSKRNAARTVLSYGLAMAELAWY